MPLRSSEHLSRLLAAQNLPLLLLPPILHGFSLFLPLSLHLVAEFPHSWFGLRVLLIDVRACHDSRRPISARGETFGAGLSSDVMVCGRSLDRPRSRVAMDEYHIRPLPDQVSCPDLPDTQHSNA